MQPGCCAFTIGQGSDKSEEWPVLIFLMQIGALINEHRRTAINIKMEVRTSSFYDDDTKKPIEFALKRVQGETLTYWAEGSTLNDKFLKRQRQSSA